MSWSVQWDPGVPWELITPTSARTEHFLTLQNNLQVLKRIMDTSQTFPKGKTLKRLKNQGKSRESNDGSAIKYGGGNISLHSTIVRKTFRTNNQKLATTLESVRRKLKMCQQEKLEAMQETQDLRKKVKTLHRVCGLKNDEIEKEVNLRIGERMAEVKSVILKATEGLHNTVPLLMEGIALCSGTSGRSSTIGLHSSMGEFGSQSSTGSRETPPIDPIDNGTKISTANRRIFAAPTMNDSESQDTSTVDRPVRSAIPPTLPTVVNDIPDLVVRTEVLYQPDMITEQYNLDDWDIDDLDEVCIPRMKKSRGRPTMTRSRSLEMFQQSLAENSENSSQEGSPLVPEESISEDTNEIEKNEYVASEEHVPEPQVDPEVNMETEIEPVNEPSKSYECKPKQLMEDNDDVYDNPKIKCLRTRSRSMNRSKSPGMQTRSKSKARARSPSPESEIEDSSAQEQNRPLTSRMSRRDSCEQTRSEESVEWVASVEAVEDIENEAATKETQPKRSVMRRNKRTSGTDEEEAKSAEESPKTSDRKSRKNTRKSKRLAVEKSAVDTKEETEAVHTDFSTDEIPKDVVPESYNEVKAVHGEGKSKCKSRRVTKEQFTADDVTIMISKEPQKEITTQAETPKINDTEKDRRGTLVYSKEEVSSSLAAKGDEERKDRRGTFVLPTAPPPAPRPKKTFSNRSILDRRAKHQEEKEVKQKVEPDRRRTYLVSKLVTPFLEVENNNGILMSSTDNDSQSSLLIPRNKYVPSPGVVPRETTVPDRTSNSSEELWEDGKKQKFQAWLSKPGDVKFTGGKMDHTVEDLTKHQRSKSRDRSTIVPKPRACSRSHSRSRPSLPIPTDSRLKSDIAPEKSDVHLITPMVGKTPSPHGQTQADNTPPTENIQLKSTESVYVVPSGKSENVESNDGVRKDESAPKRPRLAASKVSCYEEPSIGSKLRQGDPGTCSIYQGIQIENRKAQPKKCQGSSRKREVLRTVTKFRSSHQFQVA